ncbi:MAG: hypothetical protein LBV49_07505 [Azonexus sp.]|jgi:hypothetical protein|nr:hypothetical protein [Azonexus sp.]
MLAGDTFIDWIDLRQDHEMTHRRRQLDRPPGAEFVPYPGHPEFFGGVRARADEFVAHDFDDDKIFYLLAAKKSPDNKNHGCRTNCGFHEGSHSTRVLLWSDGNNVRISGNVGRIDRPDNVWNYNFAETITLANCIARANKLPDFTPGQNFLRETISEDDKRKGVSPWMWSGAHVNELHITRNYMAGSDLLAIESMRDMRGRRLARVSKAAYGDETISFGMPQKKGQRLHRAIVVYRKGPEMLAHARGDEAKAAIKASAEYQFAMDFGLIRVELKCGADYLRGKNLRYLGDIDMSKLIALYNAETAPLLLARADNTVRLVDAMPRKLRMTALSWIDGRDMRGLMAPATFKRHRKALLEYGLDITEPRNDGRSTAEEILQQMLDSLPQHQLRPVAAPEWYGLPEIDTRRAA